MKSWIYHVHIVVVLQSCRDICLLWRWFNGSNIDTFPKSELRTKYKLLYVPSVNILMGKYLPKPPLQIGRDMDLEWSDRSETWQVVL